MRTAFLSCNVSRHEAELLGLDWRGPPNPEFLKSLSEQVASADQSGMAGLIVDLRDQEEHDDKLLAELARLRRPMMQWVSGERGVMNSSAGIVIACRDTAHIRQLERWVAECLDCPTFWFAAGFVCLEAGHPDSHAEATQDMVRAANAAISRLRVHPVVAAGDRAHELFDTCKVDALDVRARAFRRPTRDPSHPTRELSVFLPGTYQSEGGASHPLPNELVISVLRHVVLAYTCDELGRPGDNTGYTLTPGGGYWFSKNAMAYVEEPIQVAVVHLKAEEEDIESLTRYLRFAWLQDVVFATLDGKAVWAQSTEPDERR